MAAVELVTTVASMKVRAAALRGQGGIALVPTMGYLHTGHQALIRTAHARCPHVVVSVFVNPTQFGPGEDYERYPRDLDRDRRMVAEAGGGIVFHPGPGDLYPQGYQTHVEPGRLAERLCGASRPGHFRGVATVVLKLFDIVRPDVAVFGEKDWQQLRVIRRMARDFDLDTEVVGHPTVREPDGLAISSRNGYLSPDERKNAVCLWKALQRGRDLIRSGEKDAAKVRAAMRGIVEGTPGTAIDYVDAVDPETLEELATVEDPALLIMAVRIGRTRLIDNLLVDRLVG